MQVVNGMTANEGKPLIKGFNLKVKSKGSMKRSLVEAENYYYYKGNQHTNGTHESGDEAQAQRSKCECSCSNFFNWTLSKLRYAHLSYQLSALPAAYKTLHVDYAMNELLARTYYAYLAQTGVEQTACFDMSDHILLSQHVCALHFHRCY
jgi:hypothetical protein